MLRKTHSHETVLNKANHLVFMWKNRRKNQSYQNLDESFYSLQLGKVGKKPRSGGKTGSFLHRNQVEKGKVHYLRGQKLSGAGAQRKPADTRVPTVHLTPQRKIRMQQ